MSKKQPRSLGLTYAAIRLDLNLSQPEMHAHLEAIDSEYEFPPPVQKLNGKRDLSAGALKKKELQRKRSIVSRWESHRGNPTFAVTHRYGLASRTYSGILDLASLVYAELRDAGSSLDSEQRFRRLEDLAARIEAFGKNIRRIAKQYDPANTRHCKRLPALAPETRMEHLDLIVSILDGFREVQPGRRAARASRK